MKGWKQESHRHSLAAKGIKTSRYMAQKKIIPMKYMASRPAQSKIHAWFVDTFGKDQSTTDSYYREVTGDRFESPRRIWQKSDLERRKALKKHFPEKFGKLDVNANVNPSYPGEYEEFQKW